MTADGKLVMMDALETEHDQEPISQNIGQQGTLPVACSAATGSAEMSGSVTETGGTFPEEIPPLGMADTLLDDSSHDEVSDVQPNSPSVIHLEPGFSLVANSVVVVKCDFGSIKPQTYTYNFTIVNTTTEPIELNYQPIMRPPPFQQEQQTPEPVVPVVIHSAESDSDLRIPVPSFGGGMSSKHGKAVKEEPVDFSITMNVSLSDTETDTLHDYGGDTTSDSLDLQKQCMNPSGSTSATTLQDQVDTIWKELMTMPQQSLDAMADRMIHVSGKGCQAASHTRMNKGPSGKSASGVHLSTDGKTLPSGSDVNQFKCETCEKYFKTKTTLARHQITHTDEKPFVCQVCSKAFAHQKTLKSHELIHTGERPYECKYPDCDKSYRQWLGLEYHVRAVHIGKREHLCEKCGMGFLTRSCLSTHEIRMHQPRTDERRYQCEYCERAFKTRDTLTLHIRTHTGEKPYKCRLCERCFRSSGQRSTHEGSHSGEKPHKCVYCGRAFRQLPSLKQHLNIHTGDRPHKCKLCEKSFAAQQTLFNHQKMHKREALKT